MWPSAYGLCDSNHHRFFFGPQPSQWFTWHLHAARLPSAARLTTRAYAHPPTHPCSFSHRRCVITPTIDTTARVAALVRSVLDRDKALLSNAVHRAIESSSTQAQAYHHRVSQLPDEVARAVEVCVCFNSTLSWSYNFIVDCAVVSGQLTACRWLAHRGVETLVACSPLGTVVYCSLYPRLAVLQMCPPPSYQVIPKA